MSDRRRQCTVGILFDKGKRMSPARVHSGSEASMATKRFSKLLGRVGFRWMLGALSAGIVLLLVIVTVPTSPSLAQIATVTPPSTAVATVPTAAATVPTSAATPAATRTRQPTEETTAAPTGTSGATVLPPVATTSATARAVVTTSVPSALPPSGGPSLGLAWVGLPLGLGLAALVLFLVRRRRATN